MHYWVRATPSDFTAGSIPIPQPRSGHTTVLVGKSKLVVFGGLLNKKFLSDIAERQGGESTVSELQKRLDISVSLTRSALEIVDELEDTEFLELASELNGNRVSNNGQEIQAVRDHWKTSNPRSIRLKDLQPLLHDYHRLVSRSLFTNAEADLQFDLLGKYSHRFYHLQNASKAA